MTHAAENMRHLDTNKSQLRVVFFTRWQYRMEAKKKLSWFKDRNPALLASVVMV